MAEPPRIDGVCGGRGCDCRLTRAAAIEFWGQEEISSFVGKHSQFPRKAKTLALKIKPPDLEMLKLIPKEREREIPKDQAQVSGELDCSYQLPLLIYALKCVPLGLTYQLI